MTHPVMHASEARANARFRALLWALSHPGSVQQLADEDGMLAIAEALLDLETSYCAPQPELHRQLLHTGARPRPVAEAAYQ
ncbi:MAG: phosphonate C-P lyase system protein PhnH, partial [Roseiflexaceae bacterium]|nr:phosphonate C-P lyase system protein PhnH [Roseiflexaceae bacterium]